MVTERGPPNYPALTGWTALKNFFYIHIFFIICIIHMPLSLQINPFFLELFILS